MSDQQTPTSQEQSQPRGGLCVTDEVKKKLREIEREKATLSPRKLQELSNAYVAYLSACEDLKSNIVTPDTDRQKAQKAGLEKFISTTMLENAGQFIAAQYIVEREYEVILRALTIIFRRVGLLATPEQVSPAPETNTAAPAAETAAS